MKLTPSRPSVYSSPTQNRPKSTDPPSASASDMPPIPWKQISSVSEASEPPHPLSLSAYDEYENHCDNLPVSLHPAAHTNLAPNTAPTPRPLHLPKSSSAPLERPADNPPPTLMH